MWLAAGSQANVKYKTFNNVNFDTCPANSKIHYSAIALRILGRVENVMFTNTIFHNISKVAIKTEADGIYTPQNIRFINGGVYEHTGTVSEIAAGSDVTYVNFDGLP
jgi:hypothetical protein